MTRRWEPASTSKSDFSQVEQHLLRQSFAHLKEAEKSREIEQRPCRASHPGNKPLPESEALDWQPHNTGSAWRERAGAGHLFRHYSSERFTIKEDVTSKDHMLSNS